MTARLDDAAAQLLAEVIDTFEKLELVIHLHRLRTGPARSAGQLADAVTVRRDIVVGELARLEAAGVVQRDGEGWRLRPDGSWSSGVAALAAAYDDDRILVLDLMTRRALERIRGQAAQAFADAFVLRKKKGKPDA